MLIDLIEETQKSFSKKEIDEEVALKLSSYHEKIDCIYEIIAKRNTYNSYILDVFSFCLCLLLQIFN